MSRQILIHPEDLLTDHKCSITSYELNKVTYGSRSASFLAGRVLNQLINDKDSMFPLQGTNFGGPFVVIGTHEAPIGSMNLELKKGHYMPLLELPNASLGGKSCSMRVCLMQKGHHTSLFCH